MKKEDRVVEQIISMITQGDYDVGDRLPAERELSKAFQTSRHTLRGAIRQLAAQGILEVRSGSGCYVDDKLDISRNWAAHPLRQTAFRDIELLEARFYLYPALATVAAQNATEEDKEALEGCLTRLSKAIMSLDVEALAVENRRFMDRVARSAHNRVLNLSFRPLNRGDILYFLCQQQI
ncbi:MAG: GntR family transcriptional regulator [Desulfobacteraceae bacterium]|jgi:DNA-binding FadR family transcriptional regulator